MTGYGGAARAALALAAASGLTALLTMPVAAQSAGTGAMNAEGVLTMQWADPRPGVIGGTVRYQLNMADGTTLPVDVPPGLHGTAADAFNKRVAVIGSATADRDGSLRLSADWLVRIDPESAADTRAVTGTRRVLYVLLKFAGDTQAPHPPAFYNALTNPLTGNASLKIPATINGYFNKTSWGKLKWQSDTVGSGGLNTNTWFTLPGNKAAYANCGWTSACFNISKFNADALALVKARGVKVSNYANISFVVNNDLDCCAWGGGIFYEGKSYGATWEPPWAQETGTYVHEYGHSIGLPHSGWRYEAYDSRWDDMSRGSVTSSLVCGSYKSANSGNDIRNINCSLPGGGYITGHKERMGWLPAARIKTISTKTTQTVTLQGAASPLGAAYKMIKVCLPGLPCTGSSARYLTVEAKVKAVDFERGLPGEGVLIHHFQINRGPLGGGNSCFFNTQSGWAVPVDSTPNDWRGPPNCDSGGRPFPNYALHNAQYGVGKTYVNTGWGIRIQVLSRSGNNFAVKVTRSK